MIYLKKINFEDRKEEYLFIKRLPEDENGFLNPFYNESEDSFYKAIIPRLINYSNGINLAPLKVPETYFFLWDDNKIVGLFKVRHYLDENLVISGGHVSYGILKEYRNMGYATTGLKLAIQKCREIIREDDIHMSLHKNNYYSLKVMLNCGAYVYSETENEYLTKIKIFDKIVINGNKFNNREEFYDHIEKVFNSKLGHNLDALNDIISSDYYHIIWLNTNKSKNDLGSYYDKIIEVMEDNKVKLDLMSGD